MSSSFEGTALLHGVVALLMVGLYVAGMVACIVYKRASGMLVLPIIGFAIGAFVWLVRMAYPFLLRDGSMDAFRLYDMATSFGGLISAGLIVGGLFAALGDVCRRLDRAQGPDPYRGGPGRRPPSGYGEERRPPDYDWGREPPAPRFPDSPDIRR
jgi:hypothetical protein